MNDWLLKFYVSAEGTEYSVRGVSQMSKSEQQASYAVLAEIAGGFVEEGSFRGEPGHLRCELTIKGREVEGGVSIKDMNLRSNMRRSEVMQELKIAALSEAMENYSLLLDVEVLAQEIEEKGPRSRKVLDQLRADFKAPQLETTKVETLRSGEEPEPEPEAKIDNTELVEAESGATVIEDDLKESPIKEAPKASPFNSAPPTPEASTVAPPTPEASPVAPSPLKDLPVVEPLQKPPAVVAARDEGNLKATGSRGLLAGMNGSRLEPKISDYATYAIPKLDGFHEVEGQQVSALAPEAIEEIANQIDDVWDFVTGKFVYPAHPDLEEGEAELICACWVEFQNKKVA